MYNLFVWFFAALIVSLGMTAFVRDHAVTNGIVTGPKLDRHIHKKAVPRLGGVAIYISVVAAMGFELVAAKVLGVKQQFGTRDFLDLLGPATIVLILGLYDDLRGAGARLKFGVQAIAAVVLYFTEPSVDHVALLSKTHTFGAVMGLPITVIWVLLVTNAFNLIDGLDGLAAGSALFSTVVVLVTALIIPNERVALISAAMGGAILGFLRFNFPPASIFLGDSGSLFVGFMLSALALMGSEKAPTVVAVAIPIVALGLPISDVMVAIARRFISGKPLFTGDARHIHHQLLKRGFSQRDAVLILYAVTGGFGFLSLMLLEGRRTLGLVLAITSLGVFVGLRQLRYHEFDELISVVRRFRQRRVLANHIAVRHGADLLHSCDTFEAICTVLQATLEPIGFDGIRLQKIGLNDYSDSSVFPFRHGATGSLAFSWSKFRTAKAPWELKLELVSSKKESMGLPFDGPFICQAGSSPRYQCLERILSDSDCRCFGSCLHSLGRARTKQWYGGRKEETLNAFYRCGNYSRLRSKCNLNVSGSNHETFIARRLVQSVSDYILLNSLRQIEQFF